eukprot:gnl/MRDRNA2_/MRDRNA2_82718_c0_seq1.p1 gnl/MRDRNA2_/MRDRNA2_82718_c0~~gnl/MRDRNA2_/MRDRNA2_82718_c0_seq1.p1  ORF type:complete len:2152 (-),score=585.31 gnl/MRDRNA2_/MRDRNA2_82718_c0_seq1:138-6137(-)
MEASDNMLVDDVASPDLEKAEVLEESAGSEAAAPDIESGKPSEFAKEEVTVERMAPDEDSKSSSSEEFEEESSDGSSSEPEVEHSSKELEKSQMQLGDPQESNCQTQDGDEAEEEQTHKVEDTEVTEPLEAAADQDEAQTVSKEVAEPVVAVADQDEVQALATDVAEPVVAVAGQDEDQALSADVAEPVVAVVDQDEGQAVSTDVTEPVVVGADQDEAQAVSTDVAEPVSAVADQDKAPTVSDAEATQVPLTQSAAHAEALSPHETTERPNLDAVAEESLEPDATEAAPAEVEPANVDAAAIQDTQWEIIQNESHERGIAEESRLAEDVAQDVGQETNQSLRGIHSVDLVKESEALPEADDHKDLLVTPPDGSQEGQDVRSREQQDRGLDQSMWSSVCFYHETITKPCLRGAYVKSIYQALQTQHAIDNPQGVAITADTTGASVPDAPNQRDALAEASAPPGEPPVGTLAATSADLSAGGTSIGDAIEVDPLGSLEMQYPTNKPMKLKYARRNTQLGIGRQVVNEYIDQVDMSSHQYDAQTTDGNFHRMASLKQTRMRKTTWDLSRPSVNPIHMRKAKKGVEALDVALPVKGHIARPSTPDGEGDHTLQPPYLAELTRQLEGQTFIKIVPQRASSAGRLRTGIARRSSPKASMHRPKSALGPADEVEVPVLSEVIEDEAGDDEADNPDDAEDAARPASQAGINSSSMASAAMQSIKKYLTRKYGKLANGFHELDENGTGFVTRDQWIRGLSRIEYPPIISPQDLFNELDINHHRMVTLNDLVNPGVNTPGVANSLPSRGRQPVVSHLLTDVLEEDLQKVVHEAMRDLVKEDLQRVMGLVDAPLPDLEYFKAMEETAHEQELAEEKEAEEREALALAEEHRRNQPSVLHHEAEEAASSAGSEEEDLDSDEDIESGLKRKGRRAAMDHTGGVESPRSGRSESADSSSAYSSEAAELSSRATHDSFGELSPASASSRRRSTGLQSLKYTEALEAIARARYERQSGSNLEWASDLQDTLKSIAADNQEVARILEETGWASVTSAILYDPPDLDILADLVNGQAEKAMLEGKAKKKSMDPEATKATKKLSILKARENGMNEALAMVARVAEAQKAGESDPEAMVELQKNLTSLATENKEIAQMLETMGVPVAAVADGTSPIDFAAAMDLDRLSESLKGEVQKTKQDQKKQALIVENHQNPKKKLEMLHARTAGMNDALALVTRVAKAQEAGESDPEALAELQQSLATLAEDSEDVAKMLETMGVPLSSAADASMPLDFASALDLDRISQSLKGEVKKAHKEEKKQASIVESQTNHVMNESKQLHESKIAATKALEAVARAKRAGNLDEEAVAQLTDTLKTLAQDNPELANMLESSGIASGSAVNLVDLGQLEQGLQGAVKHAAHAEKKNQREIAKSVKKAEAKQESMSAALALVKSAAEAQHHGEFDPDMAEELQEALANLAEECPELEEMVAKLEQAVAEGHTDLNLDQVAHRLGKEVKTCEKKLKKQAAALEMIEKEELATAAENTAKASEALDTVTKLLESQKAGNLDPESSAQLRETLEALAVDNPELSIALDSSMGNQLDLNQLAHSLESTVKKSRKAEKKLAHSVESHRHEHKSHRTSPRPPPPEVAEVLTAVNRVMESQKGGKLDLATFAELQAQIRTLSEAHPEFANAVRNSGLRADFTLGTFEEGSAMIPNLSKLAKSLTHVSLKHERPPTASVSGSDSQRPDTANTQDSGQDIWGAFEYGSSVSSRTPKSGLASSTPKSGLHKSASHAGNFHDQHIAGPIGGQRLSRRNLLPSRCQKSCADLYITYKHVSNIMVGNVKATKSKKTHRRHTTDTNMNRQNQYETIIVPSRHSLLGQTWASYLEEEQDAIAGLPFERHQSLPALEKVPNNPMSVTQFSDASTKASTMFASTQDHWAMSMSQKGLPGVQPKQPMDCMTGTVRTPEWGDRRQIRTASPAGSAGRKAPLAPLKCGSQWSSHSQKWASMQKKARHDQRTR